MRKLFCLAVIAAAAVFAAQVDGKIKATKSIKEIMAEGHKGSPPLCGKASMGKATKEDLDKLVALYEDLVKDEPKKGDKKVWKEKTEALLTATKKLATDPTNKEFVKAYAAAVNCKACHTDFK